MGAIDKINLIFMDSIELLTKTAEKNGQKCSVHVTSGDVYSGHYCGYCESTKENTHLVIPNFVLLRCQIK